MMAIRFRGRVRWWAQPYLLRRRYRAYVLAAEPALPGQRAPDGR
jgi:hypothetical protein